MDRIWLESYPPGIPATINPDEFRSLQEVIERAIERSPERPAFTCLGRTLTYGDLDGLAEHFAGYLQKVARLRKGDRLAVMLPNVLQYPVALVAAFRAGLTVVNTNPLYTPRELQHQLSDSGARAILILENVAHTLAEVVDDTEVATIVVAGVGDLLGWPRSVVVNGVVRHVRRQVPEYSLPNAISFAQAMSHGKFENPERVPLGPDDIAFLQYTGGTTGVAKGAVLTHRNLVANILQLSAWFRPALENADGEPLDSRGATIVGALPLYHIFALTQTLFFMSIAGHDLLIVNPRDFRAFVADLRKHRFTFFSGVNTLFNALLHTPGFESLDFSGLRVSLGGGMAVQRTVAEQWQRITGNVLTQAWGLTETSPGATINPVDLTGFNGSIGLPLPSTDITVRDDTGSEVPRGQTGELCVRGPQVMREYWGKPEETANVLLADRTLRTGDIGHIDARGFVYLEDRKKDMILVSGFNVYPNEVEDVLASHPGVREVAAVAQQDERAGEVVAVFIVRKEPSLTEEQVIEFSRTELTPYKVPKHVYFRDQLPKTNVGKILRRQLRDELAKR